MKTIEAWSLGNHKSKISFWGKSADVRTSAQDVSFTFGGTHALADVNSAEHTNPLVKTLINPLISYNAENIREGSMLEH
jgi:hypothetical protein